MNKPIKNIAMWSGPRNLSTAMMYCFAQRSDCMVADEPYYAAYLSETGIQHAMHESVIDAGEIDPNKVAIYCAEKSNQQTLFYQKHMTKHMIPSFDREWVHQMNNVFLIREPAKVIASYHAKQQDPELTDIGVKEQIEIFSMVKNETGEIPIVINSDDILSSPENKLKILCNAIGIEFQSAMLHWPKGPKSYDGVWAPHWYHSVWQSSGFSKPKESKVKVPTHLLGLLETANGYYEQLNMHTI